MSDEKKYSAEYAAQMVLKKAYDMVKAKGTGWNRKIGAHESRKYGEQSKEKGIHTPYGAYPGRKETMGESLAGYSAKDKTPKLTEQAKESHKKVISEMKEMPKPNLPKSEDKLKAKSIKNKKIEKCGDMETYKKGKKLKAFVEKVNKKKKKSE